MRLDKFFYTILLLTLLIIACKTEKTKTTAPTAAVTADTLSFPPLSGEEIKKYNQQLTHFFDTGLLKSSFNGAILIAKNGTPVYEKYYGIIEEHSTDSLTPITPFHIASVSKTFTGLAVVKLAQEGKLNLNDDVQKFFPEFPYPGITVKLLLNHRSGLSNYIHFIPESKKWGAKDKIYNNDVLNYIIKNRPPLNASTDKKFYYSNTNYLLLACIVEKVTGESFPAYMKRTVFDPLEMHDTYVYTPDGDALPMLSQTPKGQAWANDNLDLTYGDKNIYSTVRDLLKWDQAIYKLKVVKQQWLDSAFTPYSHEKAGIHNYGLGFRLLTLPNGKRVNYHYGRWHGFNAAFAHLVDENATIIITGSRFTKAVYSQARGSYNIFGQYGNEEVQE